MSDACSMQVQRSGGSANMSVDWTGETASALQHAMRLTHEAFAERLGIGVRTVASWHQKPDTKPRADIKSILDTALEQAPDDVKARFAKLISGGPLDLPTGAAEDAELRLT